MKRKITMVALVAFCSFHSFGQAPAIIYQDTSANTNLLETFTQLQIGDEVFAAGGAREISQIQVGLTMQGNSGTGNFVLRLYDNTGAGGQPGLLLWQSPMLNNVPVSGTDDFLSFNVPDVLVPDTFTWTIQISNETPVAVGLVGAGSPSVGASPPYIWFGGPGEWTASSPPGNPPNFQATIFAVPEPGKLSLLFVAASVFAWRYRQGNTRAEH